MIELTKEILDKMAEVDVRDVDINELSDLQDIVIDTKEPVSKKLRSFAEQSANIYIHRMGDYVVKVRFQENGPSIDDKMEEYVRRLAEIHI